MGGTVLALIIGHRISIAIDFFTDKPFDAEKLGTILSAKYKLDNLETDHNTINCFIEDVKSRLYCPLLSLDSTYTRN